MFGKKRREEREREAVAAEAEEQAAEAIRASETDDSFADPDEQLETEEEPGPSHRVGEERADGNDPH